MGRTNDKFQIIIIGNGVHSLTSSSLVIPILHILHNTQNDLQLSMWDWLNTKNKFSRCILFSLHLLPFGSLQTPVRSHQQIFSVSLAWRVLVLTTLSAWQGHSAVVMAAGNVAGTRPRTTGARKKVPIVHLPTPPPCFIRLQRLGSCVGTGIGNLPSILLIDTCVSRN